MKMLSFLGKTKFSFLRMSKPMMSVSIVCIIGGMLMFYQRGDKV